MGRHKNTARKSVSSSPRPVKRPRMEQTRVDPSIVHTEGQKLIEEPGIPNHDTIDDQSDSMDDHPVTEAMLSELREEAKCLVDRYRSMEEEQIEDLEAEAYGSDEEDFQHAQGQETTKPEADVLQLSFVNPEKEKVLEENKLDLGATTHPIHPHSLPDHTDLITPVTNTSIHNAASTEAVGATNKKKDKRTEYRKKKRCYFDPRMWPEGKQDMANFHMSRILAAKDGTLRCHETGVQLDWNEHTIGGLWAELRKHELFDAREGSPSMDRRELLKACFRLGRMMNPTQLSRLLGGGARSPEYCRFVLAAFLGLFNINKTRHILRNDSVVPKEKPHTDVIVYADEMYQSDDEMLDTWEKEMLLEPRDATHSETVGTPLSKVKDGPPPEHEINEFFCSTFPFERIQFAEADDEAFANSLSYVLRNYLSNIMGLPLRRFGEFFIQGDKLGMTFESAAKSVLSRRTRGIGLKTKPAAHRLKWLTEPMPAPELGQNKSVKLGTMDLWRHACNQFSVQQLARMSLIEHNRLVDWLCYVALESEVSKNDQTYNRERNIVVSIAPIPTLYLADLAAQFALKVLAVASHAAQCIPTGGEESEESCRIITDDDIRYATGWVLSVEDKHRLAYELHSESTMTTMVLPQGSWPHLVVRPLSESEQFVLCDRIPVNRLSVPINVVHEAKAVLDSYKVSTRRHLYAQKQLSMSNPIAHSSAQEKKRILKQGRDWRKQLGLEDERATANITGQSEASNADVGITPTGDGEQSTGPDPKIDHIGVDAKENEFGVDRTEVMVAGDLSTDNDPTWRPENTTSMAQDIENKTGKSESAAAVSNLLGVDVEVSDEFLSMVNAAEFARSKIGSSEIDKRLKALKKTTKEDEKRMEEASRRSLKEFLEASKNMDKTLSLSSTISYHRLGWLCLHALGDDVNHDNSDKNNLLGYGSTANFTNFGEYGAADCVTIGTDGLDALIKITDQHVRREAETLMACAVHDDGRPWVDRADVVLVTSLRKQEYKYGDIGL